jgi:hypothetical protein
MWIVREIRRPALLGRSPSWCVLAATLLAADYAAGEIIKKQDLLRGITIARAQCEATSETLWLNTYTAATSASATISPRREGRVRGSWFSCPATNSES